MIAVIALYFFTVWLCYFGFSEPSRFWVRGWVRTTLWILFGIYLFLAFGPILGKDIQTRNLYHFFFIWPLSYAVLWRDSLQRILQNLTNTIGGKLAMVMLFLWLLEAALAIDFVRTGYIQNYGVEQYISYSSPMAIFMHLWVYIGFYVGLTLVIVLFALRKHITPKQGFIAGALLGLTVEQNFLVPKMLFSGQLFALLPLVPWTMLTYGWYVAGPLLFFHKLNDPVTPAPKKTVLIFSVLLFTVPLAMWLVWQKIIGLPLF